MHKFKYNAVRSGDRDLQFWKNGDHPIGLWSLPVIKQKLDYIHLNPVRQEIVTKPEHYVFSSAINYTGENGLIDVDCIDIPMTMVGYITPTNL